MSAGMLRLFFPRKAHKGRAGRSTLIPNFSSRHRQQQQQRNGQREP